MVDTTSANELKATRKLGVTTLVFFVLGAAAPLTIVSGFVPIGILAGGESVVMGFIVPGLVYLTFAAGYAAMSRHFYGEGAFYAYITRALGVRVGGAAGLVSYLGYLGGQVGFTCAAGVFGSILTNSLFGVDVHWVVFAIAFTLVAGALSYRSVHIGARVLAVLLILEVAILVAFCVAVLAQGGHSGFTFTAFSPEVIFSAALPGVFVLTFTAFIGFEQTAIYSQEVKDPKRSVARATYIAVISLAVFYSFCAWVILQAIGFERMGELLAGDPSTLVFALNDEFAGTAMTLVMQILIVTSFFAGILALQNVCGRYLHALAQRRMIPRAFASVGADTGTPTVATVVHGALVAVLVAVFAIVGTDPLLQTVPWTNTPTILAVLTMQILTSIAVVAFFREDARGESVWVRLILPIAAAVLVAAALVLLVSQMGLLTMLEPAGNAILFIPLVVGAIVGYVRASIVAREDAQAPAASDAPQ